MKKLHEQLDVPTQESDDFHQYHNMAILTVLSFVLSLGFFTQPAFTHAEEKWVSYEVTISDDHLATLKADLMLAAPPETVYAVLSDYPNWPDLFAQRPTMNDIQRNNNQVRIDMTLTVSFLPVGMKLTTVTKEIPTIILSTTLVEGDFEQYDWEWTIRPGQDAQHTNASVVINVQPSVWIPHWLFEWLLTSGFTDHFDKLRDAVETQHREHGQTPSISSPKDLP